MYKENNPVVKIQNNFFGGKMKKKIIFLTLIALLTLTLISAGSGKVREGERLIFWPPGEGELWFTPKLPFHIAHGWRSAIPGSTMSTARGGLRLVIDEEEVKEDFIEYVTEVDPSDGLTYLTKYFVFNFPEGMEEGDHTFVFNYSNVCWIMEEKGEVESCEKPNAIVESTVPYKDYVVHFVTP